MRKWVLFVSVLAVTGLLAGVLSVASPTAEDTPTISVEYPALASHRGGRIVNPEATMKAFRNIRDNHPDMLIEMDVHQLKDGALVIWHDVDVDGVPVKNMTTAQWRKVTVPDPAGGTAPAPFLNEVLTEFGNTDTVLVIELKPNEALSPFIEALWPYRGNIITQTFTAASTNVLVRSGFHAMQLSSSWQPPIVPGAYAIGVKESLMTDETIGRARAADQFVWAWTVDDQTRMNELFAMGVDGVMSNDPRLTIP